MRALKEWSGFTYRQLQRRAEKAGGTLPHSTIAAVMSRSTLPREDLLRTFVQACGGDESAVADWLAARKRIAAAAADPSPANGRTGTAGPPIAQPGATPTAPVQATPTAAADVALAARLDAAPAAGLDATPGAAVGAALGRAGAAAPATAVAGGSAPPADASGPALPVPGSPAGTGAAEAATATEALAGSTGSPAAPPADGEPASVPPDGRPGGVEAAPATERIAVVDQSWRQPDRPAPESSEPEEPTPEAPDAGTPGSRAVESGAVDQPTAETVDAAAPEAVSRQPEAPARAARRPRHARTDGTGQTMPAKDYQAGSLASTARSQKKEQWVGVHRYDPAVEVPRPRGLRWLIPPIMYRTGWSSRVLAGMLVVVMAFIAVAVTARALRDIGGEVPSTAQDPEIGPIDEAPGEADSDVPGPTGSATPSAAPSPTARNAAAGRAKPTATAKAADNRAAAAATTFSGRYRVHLAHTGMCVGEGPELYKTSGREVLGQHPCAEAAPPISLERVSGNVYRIKLHHPVYGIGCATIDGGGRYDGLLLAGDDCDNAREDQKYLVEPVSSPATGYRIRSVPGSAYCIGVYEGSTAPGVQLISTRCSGGKQEIFTFERA